MQDRVSRQIFFLRRSGMSALLFVLCIAAMAQPPDPKRRIPAPVAWNPTLKQSYDNAATFLLDAEQERLALLTNRGPGRGGLMNGDSATGGQTVWDGVKVIPGRFRPGLQCVKPNTGLVWMPANGIFDSREFTVELWLRASVPWDKAQTGSVLSLGSYASRGGVRLTFSQKALRLQYRAYDDPRSAATAEIAYDLTTKPYPANQWRSVAFTFKGGVLRLYVDGHLAGEKPNLPTLPILPESGLRDGLNLMGGMTQFSLSDLRISRTARDAAGIRLLRVGNQIDLRPDQLTPADCGAIACGETIRPNLLGGLHTLGGDKTERMAKGGLRVLRTANLITVTPIVAGSPDDSHPTPGISGRFSYDWQVVDRTMDYFARLGVTPYLSLDSTPQILGGGVPPFSGYALTHYRCYQSSYSARVPNDLTAYGDIVRDLVYHIVKERGDVVPYWGVWNEPDFGFFWYGSFDDYLDLYAVCARAVKSVDPTLKIGGPETAYFQPALVTRLAAYCAANHVPLDFISWHYYSGSLSDIAAMRRLVDSLSRENGLPRLELVNGEWCWNTSALPGSKQTPWNLTNNFINDWHAAFVGASLIEMQNAGVALSVFTNPVAPADGLSFAGSGLMSETQPWATLNVYRLWSQMKPNLFRAEYNGLPGISALASKDARGTITVSSPPALLRGCGDGSGQPAARLWDCPRHRVLRGRRDRQRLRRRAGQGGTPAPS